MRSKMYESWKPALLIAALAFFVCVSCLVMSPHGSAQKIKQLGPPPPVPRLKPKPTPTPEPIEYEVVRVTSNLIVVPVSVTNVSGEPVLGLPQNNFQIEEDGRVQQIAQMGNPEQVPLDIALLIDVSASVESRFGFEQRAAADFLKQVMKQGDRATVFAIDEAPRQIQGLSNSDVAARKVMTLAAAKGFTAFFDSLLAAEKYLDANSSQGRRRVIVVLSDGDDTARINEMASRDLATRGNSKFSQLDNQVRFIERAQDDVLREIQRGEVTFYSINPSGRTMHLNVRVARGETGMEKFANATGGAAFVPASESDLPQIFQRIASEIRSQYLLQYYSDNKAGGAGFRRIKVTTPTRADLRVRAREGYYPKGK